MTTMVAHNFPVDLLDGCRSALVLFAAAFGGVQDAAFVRDAGIRATCVDTDSARLREMKSDYPDDWRFIAWDAFALFPFLYSQKFDVVTLDPFSGDMMDKTIEHLAAFCAFARKAAIVGTGKRRIRAPEGWRVHSRTFRTNHDGGIFWTNLVPA